MIAFISLTLLLESRYTFYVGETKNFNRRMAEHLDDEAHGSDWTNERSPQDVADCFWSRDRWDEGKTTGQYMSLYGIIAVQGGATLVTSWTSKTADSFSKLNEGVKKCASTVVIRNILGVIASTTIGKVLRSLT